MFKYTFVALTIVSRNVGYVCYMCLPIFILIYVCKYIIYIGVYDQVWLSGLYNSKVFLTMTSMDTINEENISTHVKINLTMSTHM